MLQRVRADRARSGRGGFEFGWGGRPFSQGTFEKVVEGKVTDAYLREELHREEHQDSKELSVKMDLHVRKLEGKPKPGQAMAGDGVKR